MNPTAPLAMVLDRTPLDPSKTCNLTIGTCYTVLREVAVDFSQIWVTSVVLCPTAKGIGGEPAEAGARSACQDRLLRELHIVQPEIIVGLGAGTRQSLLRKESKKALAGVENTNIMPAPGRFTQALIPGDAGFYRIPTLITYSLAQDSKIGQIVEHLREALTIALEMRRRSNERT